MNPIQHPDEELLNAFQHQPDTDAFKEVSLHLASCKHCREQVATSNLLKSGFNSINQQQCSEQQQQIVDDFLYNDLSTPEKNKARQIIKEDPVLLKSALFGLSHQIEELSGLKNSAQDQIQSDTQPWLGRLTEWFQWQTTTWTTVAVSTVMAVTLTALVLQGRNSATAPSITVASYQDNKIVRFLPKNDLPGIGFFTAANVTSKPFQSMQITYSDQQNLQLNWEPIKNVSEYDLSIYEFSQGEKKLQNKLSVSQTQASINLSHENYNQRFEWVLSGITNDDKSFITTGGFIIHQLPNSSGL